MTFAPVEHCTHCGDEVGSLMCRARGCPAPSRDASAPDVEALRAEVAALRAIVDPLREIAKDVATQDNRITAEPIFNVEEWRGIQGWHVVQPFFTERGAQSYLDTNGHNLAGGRGHVGGKKPPRIYAEGSFRNDEWRTLRSALLAIAALGGGV